MATAEAGDDEMKRRIEKHKQVRPDHWRTLETPRGVGGAIREEIGGATMVLVDCITLLVTNVLCQESDWQNDTFDVAAIERAIAEEMEAIVDVMQDSKADFVLVTNEVGLGIIPDNPMSRIYRDLLGKANQMLASACDRAYLLVSGLPLQLK